MQPPWRPCPCRSFEWTWLRPRSWKSCVKLARSRKSCVASYERSTFLAWQCPSPGNSSPDSPPSFSATTARRRTYETPFNASNGKMSRCRTWSRLHTWRSRRRLAQHLKPSTTSRTKHRRFLLGTLTHQRLKEKHKQYKLARSIPHWRKDFQTG